MTILMLPGNILNYQFWKILIKIFYFCGNLMLQSVIKSLGNIQLAESLRSWYLYREEATRELWSEIFRIKCLSISLV